jgi:hypothetical protein
MRISPTWFARQGRRSRLESEFLRGIAPKRNSADAHHAIRETLEIQSLGISLGPTTTRYGCAASSASRVPSEAYYR